MSDADRFWEIVSGMSATKAGPDSKDGVTEITIDAEWDGDPDGGRAKFTFGKDGTLSKVEVYEYGTNEPALPWTY